MSEKRNVRLFIQDIFDAIQKIDGYVSLVADEKELKNDRKTYDAVMMNFIIISEAVKTYTKLSEKIIRILRGKKLWPCAIFWYTSTGE